MNSIIQVIFVIPDFVRRWEKYVSCTWLPRHKPMTDL
jgi:hypothetical protein